MGEIKLNGLGYDTKPSYENNLRGLNAGYLNYSKTRLQGHPGLILSIEIDPIHPPVLFILWTKKCRTRPITYHSDCAAGNLKYHCGYSAHVILGETYQLDDIGNKDAHFELHDLYPEDDQQTAEIELRLCVGGNCQTCILKKENRKWITHEGVDEEAEQNNCGRVYNNLRGLMTSNDV